LEVLKRWGAPTVELEKRIRALGERDSAKPTLHGVLGKITVAEGKSKKAAEHVVRLEGHLESAKEKALAAAKSLAEWYRQRDLLLVARAGDKSSPAVSAMDTSEVGEFTQPEGLSEDDAAKWQKLVADQRTQLEALKCQQQRLHDAFQAECDSLASKSAVLAAKTSILPGANAPAGGDDDKEKKELDARAAMAERQKKQDADANFKRVREEESAEQRDRDKGSAASSDCSPDAQALLERQLELARAAKSPKQDEASAAS